MSEGPVLLLYVDLDRDTPFPLPELLVRIDGLRVLRGTVEEPEVLKQRALGARLIAVNVGAAGDDQLSALSRVRRLVPMCPMLIVVADEAAERRILKLEPQECVLRDTASRSVLLRFIRRGLARGRVADPNPAAAPTRSELSMLIACAREMFQEDDCCQVVSIAVRAGKRLTGATLALIILLGADGEAEALVFDEPGRRGSIPEGARSALKAIAQVAFSVGTAFDNAFASSQLARLLPAGHSPVDTALLVPLRRAEAPIGLIALGNKPGGFDESDTVLATHLGELVAISIERCRSVQAQRTSSRQLRALLDQVAPALVAANAGGEISVWTTAAEQSFGWSSKEMLGKPVASFVAAGKEGQRLARRSDGSEVELHPVGLGDGAEDGEAWALAPLSAGIAYELSCGPANFGALRRVTGAPVRIVRDGAAAAEACYHALHGREAPCPDCPALLPVDQPWPRIVVRRPEPPNGTVELVTAELPDPSTAKITVQYVAERALGALLQAKVERLASASGLSDREREVVVQLVMGWTLEDIGAALGISTRTVKFHQTNALQKLGADSRVGLMRMIV